MTVEEKAALAKANFEQGYNCAQSVLLAFGEETGLEPRQAARLGSAFGGGMGRMREVCGAVSAMFMIEGLLAGYDDPKARDQKNELYAKVRALAEQFREKNQSIVCRELLSGTGATTGGTAEERTQAYYKRRPCSGCVEDAARIIAGAIGLPEA